MQPRTAGVLSAIMFFNQRALHKCSFCDSLVIDLAKAHNKAGTISATAQLSFNTTMTSIRSALLHGCHLCKFLVDREFLNWSVLVGWAQFTGVSPSENLVLSARVSEFSGNPYDIEEVSFLGISHGVGQQYASESQATFSVFVEEGEFPLLSYFLQLWFCKTTLTFVKQMIPLRSSFALVRSTAKLGHRKILIVSGAGCQFVPVENMSSARIEVSGLSCPPGSSR
jgi:hypothetical protein